MDTSVNIISAGETKMSIKTIGRPQKPPCYSMNDEELEKMPSEMWEKMWGEHIKFRDHTCYYLHNNEFASRIMCSSCNEIEMQHMRLKIIKLERLVKKLME